MQRPASILVFGILNIVFGLLGICGLAGTSAILLVSNNDPKNVSIQVMKDSPTYMGFLAVATFVGLIATIALVVCGFGLINNKNWARKGTVFIGWYQLVGAVVGLVMNAVCIWGPLLERAAAEPQPALALGMRAGLIGGVVGTVIGMIWPAASIYFMTRPHVIAYLTGATTADPNVAYPRSETGNPYQSP